MHTVAKRTDDSGWEVYPPGTSAALALCPSEEAAIQVADALNTAAYYGSGAVGIQPSHDLELWLIERTPPDAVRAIRLDPVQPIGLGPPGQVVPHEAVTLEMSERTRRMTLVALDLARILVERRPTA